MSYIKRIDFSHELHYVGEEGKNIIEYGYYIENFGFYSILEDSFYSNFELENSKKFNSVDIKRESGFVEKEIREKSLLKRISAKDYKKQ